METEITESVEEFLASILDTAVDQVLRTHLAGREVDTLNIKSNGADVTCTEGKDAIGSTEVMSDNLLGETTYTSKYCSLEAEKIFQVETNSIEDEINEDVVVDEEEFCAAELEMREIEKELENVLEHVELNAEEGEFCDEVASGDSKQNGIFDSTEEDEEQIDEPTGQLENETVHFEREKNEDNGIVTDKDQESLVDEQNEKICNRENEEKDADDYAVHDQVLEMDNGELRAEEQTKTVTKVDCDLQNEVLEVSSEEQTKPDTKVDCDLRNEVQEVSAEGQTKTDTKVDCDLQNEVLEVSAEEQTKTDTKVDCDLQNEVLEVSTEEQTKTDTKVDCDLQNEVLEVSAEEQTKTDTKVDCDLQNEVLEVSSEEQTKTDTKVDCDLQNEVLEVSAEEQTKTDTKVDCDLRNEVLEVSAEEQTKTDTKVDCDLQNEVLEVSSEEQTKTDTKVDCDLQNEVLEVSAEEQTKTDTKVDCDLRNEVLEISSEEQTKTDTKVDCDLQNEVLEVSSEEQRDAVGCEGEDVDRKEYITTDEMAPEHGPDQGDDTSVDTEGQSITHNDIKSEEGSPCTENDDGKEDQENAVEVLDSADNNNDVVEQERNNESETPFVLDEENRSGDEENRSGDEENRSGDEECSRENVLFVSEEQVEEEKVENGKDKSDSNEHDINGASISEQVESREETDEELDTILQYSSTEQPYDGPEIMENGSLHTPDTEDERKVDELGENNEEDNDGCSKLCEERRTEDNAERSDECISSQSILSSAIIGDRAVQELPVDKQESKENADNISTEVCYSGSSKLDAHTGSVNGQSSKATDSSGCKEEDFDNLEPSVDTELEQSVQGDENSYGKGASINGSLEQHADSNPKVKVVDNGNDVDEDVDEDVGQCVELDNTERTSSVDKLTLTKAVLDALVSDVVLREDVLSGNEDDLDID
ncbi:Hypothetical predicted protein [Paramuricea clavata]|nr:Hypothetical predicted protein [Paramuricea clavata]